MNINPPNTNVQITPENEHTRKQMFEKKSQVEKKNPQMLPYPRNVVVVPK